MSHSILCFSIPFTLILTMALRTAGDPLNDALNVGAPLGFLGLELETRRRNRMNGKIVSLDASAGTFQIKVDLSFGNCPKYIQARRLHIDPAVGHSIPLMRSWAASHSAVSATYAGPLRAVDASFLRTVDTFYVASAFGTDASNAAHGVDVSHRGGRPGFIRVSADGSTLEWPDYIGNFIFNTLGNIAKNPKCGLVFIDFEGNRVIQLSGLAQIVWDSADLPPGAQRMIQFKILKTRVVGEAMPFKWTFLGMSPYAPVVSMVGAPAGTNARTGLVGLPLAIKEIKRETHDTATYLLSAGIALTHSLRPGQHASFIIDEDDNDEESEDAEPIPLNQRTGQVRTWTISSAPDGPSDYHFSITVRRKPGGSISNRLFEGKINKMMLTGIGGTFHLPSTTSTPPRPLLFIAGGVGITPLMSMLRGLIIHCHPRDSWKVHLVYSVQTSKDVIFQHELAAISSSIPEQFKVSLFITRDAAVDRTNLRWKGWDLFVGERVSAQRLAMIDADIRQKDVYLCGPNQFMTDIEGALTTVLNVPACQVFSEHFDY